jgi:hypothetical protein
MRQQDYYPDTAIPPPSFDLGPAKSTMRATTSMRCCLVLLIVCTGLAAAAEPSVTTQSDPRAVIKLAPARHDNWQCLMRGHLQSLIDSMRYLASGEYEAAAAATEDHYGLRPGTVEYCREALFTKQASVSAATLPPAPPQAVSAMFVSMHDAARKFAAEARKARNSGDPMPAWKALAAVAEYCSACHATYRLE